LLAYGKSLFNLGWRYEHAIGARRNLTEAARCYWKAARLGDASAVGRINPAQAAVHVGADPESAPCPVP
jgi:TPR repeat protein